MPTPRLALPYIVQSQAQKEVTHNDALNALDILVQAAVLDRDAVSPPGAPGPGDRYIVGTGATGAWAGRDGHLAAWIGTAWRFVAPAAGFLAFVIDEGIFLSFDGAGWVALGGSGGTGIGDVAGLSAALAAKLDDTDAALFATAAQGALADSAVQPGDLAVVAASGAYADLSGRPTLGTAAALDVGTGVQAFSAKLADIVALIWAADTAPYFTGAGTADKFAFSSYMRGLMNAASASALLAAIGALPLAGGTMAGNLDAGAGVAGGDARLRLGNGRAAAGNAYIDIYSGTGAGDVSRWVRYAGTNGSTNILHRGTGDFALIPQDGGPLVVTTGVLEWGRITASGFSCQGRYFVTAEGLHRLRAMTIATLSALTPSQGDLVYVGDLGGGAGVCCYNGSVWCRVKEAGQQTIATDAALSLAYPTNAPTIAHTGTLTADRAVTLPTANVPNGARFHIARSGGGAFNLNVNASTTKALTTNTWCTVEYNGSAWTVIAAGSL